MKKMLNEACELLKVGHAVAEEDPMFTKMMISQAIGLIDQALFEDAMRNKAEQAMERLMRDLEKML